MRHMKGFSAASIHPFRRLCHPYRHIVAVSVQYSASAAAASTLLFTNSRSLGTQPSASSTLPQSDASSGAEADGSKLFENDTFSGAAANPAVGDSLSTEFPSTSTSASPSVSAPAAELSRLTLEKIDAFVRRHDYLCVGMGISSTLPPLPASDAAGQAGSPNLQSNMVVEGGVLASAPDGQHRHSARALHATEAVVGDIRTMLDRVAQEAPVLGALTEKQRQRLITDVCRIGYVVGLHRRCAALYVDTVLPTSKMSRHSAGDDDGRSFDPQRQSHESGAAVDGTTLSIPDFVLDAAGEAADLGTLERCLAYVVQVFVNEDEGTSSPGASETPEMHSGWLAALQIFALCVRVALQHNWYGPPLSAIMQPPQRSASSGVEPNTVVDHEAKKGRSCDGAWARSSVDGAANTNIDSPETSAMDARRVEELWYTFTMRVLRLLRLHDGGEAFFRATLRSARYHYAQAGGDWSAAHAAVYASCFRCWFGEAEQTNTTSPYPAASGSTRKHGKANHLPLSPSAAPSPTVRLTCPALVVLLRTAVAARQHDIAEWATLYADACLDDWTSEGGRTFGPGCHETAKAASVSSSSSAATAQLDMLLMWYLRYLQQSNQRHRACCWLRRLRTRQPSSPLLDSALPSLPVLRVAARLAGEGLDADVALWCLQLCLDDTPGRSPTHLDIFTCLCAYARCGLPTFDMVLRSLLSNGLLRPTAEELLFVRLLHARRSVCWRREWEQCMAQYVVTTTSEEEREKKGVTRQKRGSVKQMEAPTVVLRLFAAVEPSSNDAARRDAASSAAACEDGVTTQEDRSCNDEEAAAAARSIAPSRTTVFSTRVMYQILLLLQEGEHTDFMPFYRTFLITFNEYVAVSDRARWALLALAWASLQHGSTPLEDVVYIAREVEQLMGLQAEHHALGFKDENKKKAAISRPLPIAADLYRSLERRWASLYQQYPPSWWFTALAGDATLLDRAGMEKMAARARAAAPATTPAFARFVRRRHLLPTADTSAPEMLLSSVRRGTSRNGMGPAAMSDLGCPQERCAALQQMDRELWAAYVASGQSI
ncbi:hypothetical protein ABB37_04774 [Leptomonas pyrrhocoris]|uniref:Uncharacterized protein n=1 Tax=Leptomonas pyrrhocoris TaxID=157538 RepID=A0A0N1J4U7_LEPPY|nr:hypothetical protein ABB37_04774 [Leptomonas pyrrhocoris]KPA80574.1 hypothetical protein ABB37_04774 [Leptomonas pyrrhocoris]|eukprot:XP_015659013.1 hypothetical protein ABB37_04774 [Leptomonas pyrrhocoris]